MQVRTSRTGEVSGVGSINHAELARLQGAAKKHKAKSESTDEFEDVIEDAPKPQVVPKPEFKSVAKPTS